RLDRRDTRIRARTGIRPADFVTACDSSYLSVGYQPRQDDPSGRGATLLLNAGVAPGSPLVRRLPNCPAIQRCHARVDADAAKPEAAAQVSYTLVDRGSGFRAWARRGRLAFVVAPFNLKRRAQMTGISLLARVRRVLFLVGLVLAALPV